MINISSKIYDLGKDKLQKIFDESSSYAEVLRKVGLIDRGGNYSTLINAIKKYGLNLDIINENRKNANIERAKMQHENNKFKEKIDLKDVFSGKISHY